MGTFFVICIILFLFLGLSSKSDKQPSRYVPEPETIINRMDMFTRDNVRNHMIAHAYLAGWLMKKNRQDSREKVRYVQGYFRSYFKGAHNVSEEMTNALRYELDLRSVIAWLNRVMKTDEPKQRIIVFLVGLGFEDGNITENEYEALIHLTKSLKIPVQFTERAIQERRDRQFRQEKAWREAERPVRTVSKRRNALQTLGIAENASEEELKKAYRRLAKQFHPDKMQQSGEAERAASAKRFVEIREAYDYLTANK